MADGQVEGCSVSNDADSLSFYRDKEGAEPKGKALNLPIDLSPPSSMLVSCSVLTERTTSQTRGHHRVSRFSLRDMKRSLDSDYSHCSSASRGAR